MEERLISYETAQLAKEKNCTLDLYNETLEYEYEDEYGDTFVCNYVPNGDDPLIFGARRKINCTQSLLQKWLREEQNILVESLYSYSDYDFIAKTGKLKDYRSYIMYEKNTFDNYEDALELALTEALKLI